MDFLGTCGHGWPLAWDKKVSVGSSSWGTALWSAESGMEAEAGLLAVLWKLPLLPFLPLPSLSSNSFLFSLSSLPLSPCPFPDSKTGGA